MSRDASDGSVEAELERGREALFSGLQPKLLAALSSKFPALGVAYVIEWIPEQGEDIYTVVLEPDAVAVVQISRVGGEDGKVDVYAPDQYRRTHRLMTRPKRRKLDVAMRLLHRERGRTC